MTTNPFFNALLAAGYIGLVVLVMHTFIQNTAQRAGDETILIPMAMLSLFVLSAATMGYLFLYQPLALWFEGKKQEALNFFLTTLAAFAVVTLALLAMLFFFV